MVVDGSYPCGEHSIRREVESFCYTPETHVTLCVSYSQMKKLKIDKIFCFYYYKKQLAHSYFREMLQDSASYDWKHFKYLFKMSEWKNNNSNLRSHMLISPGLPAATSSHLSSQIHMNYTTLWRESLFAYSYNTSIFFLR